MSWLETYSGNRFDFLFPDPGAVNIRDIARALSMQCRFNGHVEFFYSVAQHSVLVARALPEEYFLHGLLHDAAEAYVGDVPRLLKELLPQFKVIEDRVHCIVMDAVGISREVPPLVKVIDHRILFNEKAALKPNSCLQWRDELDPLPNITIEHWSPERAEAEFLAAYLSHRSLSFDGGLI